MRYLHLYVLSPRLDPFDGPADGFAALSSTVSGAKEDSMPSFWLAETLKYLYLLMDPHHTYSLNDFTFTTEAHPLRIANHRTSR